MYDAEPLIEESMRTLYYGRLPCFLNSFCRRDVLDEARARAGALFASLCPDIYSGFLLAAVAGRVYVMNRIMGVGGVSGGSTGGNAQLDPLGPATQAYMNDYKDQPLLPGLIGFPFTASAILDSAVRALNALGRRISIEDALNPQSYAEYCYRQAMLYPMPARAQGIAAVRDYIAHQPPARARAMERRLGLKRAQWMLKDRLPAWAVRPLQSAWHRMHGGSGALKAAGSDRTGELLFDDVYEAASHLTRYHRAPAP
jgi:hypothetical protein